MQVWGGDLWSPLWMPEKEGLLAQGGPPKSPTAMVLLSLCLGGAAGGGGVGATLVGKGTTGEANLLTLATGTPAWSVPTWPSPAPPAPSHSGDQGLPWTCVSDKCLQISSLTRPAESTLGLSNDFKLVTEVIVAHV